MQIPSFVPLLVLALFPGFTASAAPEVGEPAPPFALKQGKEKTIRLADHRGARGVVLAWFPKAFTAG